MSTKGLRVRLDRLSASVRPAPGQDRDRDRRRRDELRSSKLCPGGLTSSEEIEYAQLDALFEEEDRDSNRAFELVCKKFDGQGLTDAERLELAELERRLPHDPDGPPDEIWDAFAAAARTHS